LPSTIYNSVAIDCRLRSTTPWQQIAVYDLQLQGNNCRLQSTTPRLKIAACSRQNCSRKMMQKSCPISRKYRRKILQQTAFYTTFNPSLFISKCYLQSLSIQQKIPHPVHIYLAVKTTFKFHLWSAENNGGKYCRKYRRKLTAENTAENAGGN
jgi:hypothetical protein